MVIPRQKGNIELPVTIVTSGSSMFPLLKEGLKGIWRGHFDNTKHLIFWLCNMKQLNFRHFNTNRKKFTVTVNFGQKETKTAPKRPILFCLVYQEVFSHFPTIPDHLRRFPKVPEDFRGEIRKFSTIFRRCIHM